MSLMTEKLSPMSSSGLRAKGTTTTTTTTMAPPTGTSVNTTGSGGSATKSRSGAAAAVSFLTNIRTLSVPSSTPSSSDGASPNTSGQSNRIGKPPHSDFIDDGQLTSGGNSRTIVTDYPNDQSRQPAPVSVKLPSPVSAPSVISPNVPSAFASNAADASGPDNATMMAADLIVNRCFTSPAITNAATYQANRLSPSTGGGANPTASPSHHHQHHRSQTQRHPGGGGGPAHSATTKTTMSKRKQDAIAFLTNIRLTPASFGRFFHSASANVGEGGASISGNKTTPSPETLAAAAASTTTHTPQSADVSGAGDPFAASSGHRLRALCLAQGLEPARPIVRPDDCGLLLGGGVSSPTCRPQPIAASSVTAMATHLTATNNNIATVIPALGHISPLAEPPLAAALSSSADPSAIASAVGPVPPAVPALLVSGSPSNLVMTPAGGTGYHQISSVCGLGTTKMSPTPGGDGMMSSPHGVSTVAMEGACGATTAVVSSRFSPKLQVQLAGGGGGSGGVSTEDLDKLDLRPSLALLDGSVSPRHFELCDLKAPLRVRQFFSNPAPRKVVMYTKRGVPCCICSYLCTTWDARVLREQRLALAAGSGGANAGNSVVGGGSGGGVVSEAVAGTPSGGGVGLTVEGNRAAGGLASAMIETNEGGSHHHLGIIAVGRKDDFLLKKKKTAITYRHLLWPQGVPDNNGQTPTGASSSSSASVSGGGSNGLQQQQQQLGPTPSSGGGGTAIPSLDSIGGNVIEHEIPGGGNGKVTGIVAAVNGADVSPASPGDASPMGSGILVPGTGAGAGTVRIVEPAESSFVNDYEPFFLDDPDRKSEKRRKLVSTVCYRTSIIPYVKKKELKATINEQMLFTHPWIEDLRLTLTMLRKIKSRMMTLARQDLVEVSSVAYAVVYFEKLVLKRKVTKETRKAVGAVCLMLAAKFLEPMLGSRTTKIEALREAVLEEFDVSSKTLFELEFPVFAELEFSLLLPTRHVYPHFERLLKEHFNQTPEEYAPQAFASASSPESPLTQFHPASIYSATTSANANPTAGPSTPAPTTTTTITSTSTNISVLAAGAVPYASGPAPTMATGASISPAAMSFSTSSRRPPMVPHLSASSTPVGPGGVFMSPPHHSAPRPTHPPPVSLNPSSSFRVQKVTAGTAANANASAGGGGSVVSFSSKDGGVGQSSTQQQQLISHRSQSERVIRRATELTAPAGPGLCSAAPPMSKATAAAAFLSKIGASSSKPTVATTATTTTTTYSSLATAAPAKNTTTNVLCENTNSSSNSTALGQAFETSTLKTTQ